MTDFIFLGSKITADGDCSHEIKRLLLLGRKVMNNLDSTLKSRDITLPTKVHLVKAMVFPVVMYGCESWTIRKAECRRIDASKPCCWRGLLRVLWTARRSNQSAGVQPQQDPGEPSGWMVLARERPSLIVDRAKSAREREGRKEGMKEGRKTRPGICSRVWQLLYFSP